MTFEEALIQLKEGQSLCRLEWPNASKGVYIAVEFPAQDCDNIEIQEENNFDSFINIPFIYYVSNTKTVFPWIPSFCDLFADDWVVINE